MAAFFRLIRIMRSGLPAVLALACLLGSVPARAAGELNGRQTIPYSQLNSLAGGGEVAWPEAAPAPERPGVVARALGAASAQAATSEAGAATQAQGAPGQALGGRGIMDSRQSLRGKVNAGGPEDWPEDSGLSTTTADVPQGGAPAQAPAPQAVPQAPAAATGAPAQAAPVPSTPASAPQTPAPQPTAPHPSAGQNTAPAPAQIPAAAPASAPAAAPTAQEAQPPEAAVPAAPAQQPEAPAVRHEGRSASGAAVPGTVGLPLGEKAAPPPEPEKPREVIYVDEQGNPVPKPPEPDKMFAEAEALMDEGKYDEALPAFEAIRQLPNLSPELLEKVLYRISDCMWARYADNPLAGFDPIVSSTSEAMNANLRSPRVPDALLRLGLANANVGNLGEAGGYIIALLRRYPDYPGVAQGLTALGEAQLKNGLNAEAEQSFGIVLDKYPESSQLQAASVGLARALVNQDKHERAQVILDFISKRWPRYYIEDPEFLLLQAANEEKMGRDDAAMDLDWLYINLDPRRQGNDSLLLKMADTYLRKGNAQAANFIYNDIVRDFPDSPAAITARLRLAEKGIYEAPITYEEMSKVFARGSEPPLWQVYSDLAASSDTTPEAVLARLKQAMWLYWDRQYPEAMGKAADFIDAYPEHQNVPEARELLWQAFSKELANSLAEQNYGRILLLWNGFPLVRERYGEPDARLRYALAQGLLERGDEDKAFELMADFLKGPMDPDYGEAAFSQFFNHYLKNGAWDKILDLAKLVESWNLQPQLRNQLDYAQALSAQNLNLGAPALAMWRKLAERTDIPLYQQAYATYFLARDAEARKDIRAAYETNRRVIELFTRLQDERSDKADPQRIKEATAALMDICEVGNRIPEALQWVERYNAYVPQDSEEYPGLRFREARLYRKLGDASRAEALLEDIVRRFPDSPFAQAAAAELRTFEVSRDLQRFMPNQPKEQKQASEGTTDGTWSSSGPARQQEGEGR
ncbi:MULTISPECIES: tetratricopeptide repeat protein [unclassified Desulfovibrio]|uniref:tetratricopeptide repeat protein n=1 Tax=unclassified Desulfovibrio TaxID=2593640 RepID=UPI0013ECF6EB|nr:MULTISPECIES: tetratricopeptide repeat protein [unclassified Desulfovibrio]